MCDYCDMERDSNILKSRDEDYPNREIYVYVHFNTLEIETYSRDGQSYSNSVNINYCPMCGRDLN